jgi:hypothetical protein
MLLRLADGLKRHDVSSVIVSLAKREPLAEEFESRGIEVRSLGMSKVSRFSDIRTNERN